MSKQMQSTIQLPPEVYERYLTFNIRVFKVDIFINQHLCDCIIETKPLKAVELSLYRFPEWRGHYKVLSGRTDLQYKAFVVELLPTGNGNSFVLDSKKHEYGIKWID